MSAARFASCLLIRKKGEMFSWKAGAHKVTVAAVEVLNREDMDPGPRAYWPKT